MKTCRECNSEKPLANFYKGSARCKECYCRRVRANRAARISYYREYDRVRSSRPERLAARSAYQKTETGAAVHARAIRKQRSISRDKYNARVAVGNAIRDGRLQRRPCEVCGARAEAHHEDYSKPLDVRWLCPKDHKARHRELRSAA